jgi:hypothetical protein
VFFEPEIQILQWYGTEKEAEAAEKAIIRATWKSKYSLNENIGGYISEEICRAAMAKMPKGILAANGRANLAKMPKETRAANGKASMTPGRAKNFGRANGRANAKALNSQRWQCLVTGFVANPGNLSRYQRARGIDTSLRVKLGRG